jgi:hypothetical protein
VNLKDDAGRHSEDTEIHELKQDFNGAYVSCKIWEQKDLTAIQ